MTSDLLKKEGQLEKECIASRWDGKNACAQMRRCVEATAATVLVGRLSATLTNRQACVHGSRAYSGGLPMVAVCADQQYR